MLILAKDYDMAAQVLALYENTVLEHEGSQTFDYGICQFMNGVLALSEGIPAKTETYLLSAETIITDVMGTDNKYTKSVYKYLYNLLLFLCRHSLHCLHFTNHIIPAFPTKQHPHNPIKPAQRYQPLMLYQQRIILIQLHSRKYSMPIVTKL